MFFDRFLKASKRYVPGRKRKSSTVKQKKVNANLNTNLEDILESTGDPDDLVIQRIKKGSLTAVVIYLETLVDSNLLSEHVIKPLNQLIQGTEVLSSSKLKITISASNVSEVNDLHQAVENLLTGSALILINGTIFAVSLPGVPRRAIEEASTEKSIKGPREGFAETIKDNIGLIRRYLKDPNLRLDRKYIGERTKTEIAVLYLNDVANPDIVKEVHKRLEQIEIDGILESGYIAELISDRRLTIFPLVQETERPDKVASALLEGRVVIMVDRSPFNIIVPVTSNEFYQIQEDFYFNWIEATMLRLVRALGTIVAVTLPGFYLAMITVNPELLPPSVIQLEASSRVQVPFPAVLEMLITFFAFEVLRESSVRFPAGISMIFGVGGGIVMGLAAINAGLVSGITVAVVVFCVLGTFSTANLAAEQAWRWVRYFLFFAGASFGFMGVIAAGILVLAHMTTLKSFGVSYMAPWAPPLGVDIADAPIRLPWWLSYRRPPTYRPQREDRLGETEGEDEA
ncbi:MAG: spore germination protein [Bacillota bacterium]|nr:spore germination protein [Bacillota bacterium]